MEGASCAIQERVGSISLRFRASEVHLTEHRLGIGSIQSQQSPATLRPRTHAHAPHFVLDSEDRRAFSPSASRGRPTPRPRVRPPRG